MAKINNIDISNKALDLRNRLGEDSFSPIDIFSLVQNLEDVTLIQYPLGKNISGYCKKYKHTSVIVINSSMTLGRQRFSLAHELYHVFYDTEMTSFVCSNFNNKAPNEQKADLFASYLLMPQTALSRLNISNPVKIGDIVRLEQFYHVSRMAVLYRLLNENIINNNELESFSKNVRRSAKLLGYDDALYKPSPESEQYYVYGKYIVSAEKLLADNKISNGKYEEYLLSAYRDDIVYGFAEGGEIVD